MWSRGKGNKSLRVVVVYRNDKRPGQKPEPEPEYVLMKLSKQRKRCKRHLETISKVYGGSSVTTGFDGSDASDICNPQ